MRETPRSPGAGRPRTEMPPQLLRRAPLFASEGCACAARMPKFILIYACLPGEWDYPAGQLRGGSRKSQGIVDQSSKKATVSHPLTKSEKQMQGRTRTCTQGPDTFFLNDNVLKHLFSPCCLPPRISHGPFALPPAGKMPRQQCQSGPGRVAIVPTWSGWETTARFEGARRQWESGQEGPVGRHWEGPQTHWQGSI